MSADYIGPSIAARGWCAGRVVPHTEVEKLGSHLTRHGAQLTVVGEGEWLVVISQTCDVVARSIQAEPFVEVLHCIPVKGKIRTQHANLRSTRRLDFKPNRDTDAALVLTAHATIDRYLIPRELLVDIDPDPNRRFDDIAVKRVAAWYALRYSRPAWPDRFVERVHAYKEKFEAAISQIGDNLEVRVAISPSDIELAPERSYQIAIWFVVDALAWNDDPSVREMAHKAFGEFINIMKTCDGIELNTEYGGVISGEDFTWQETRTTDEWNFANLSHSE